MVLCWVERVHPRPHHLNSTMKPASDTPTTIAVNKKALHDYEVLEKVEAGIKLLGSEVKALRHGTVHFPGSYVVARTPPQRQGARKRPTSLVPGSKPPVPVLQLINVHIGPYGPAGPGQHLPLRARTLLVRRKEAERIAGALTQKGHTAVPLELHLRHGLVKVTVALVRGKQLHDKRRTMKEREVKRALEQATKRR